MKQHKVHLCLWLLLTLAGFYASAQQGNNWYFGFKAGLNFNTNPPTPLLDGQLNTKEGCSSISDNNGNLLLYTNGDTVFNKLHQVMQNGTGLFGHISSYQSSVIVPRPGSNNIYYIFTADAQENIGSRGFNYSIVDISRNGGLGEVIQKNILLYAPSSERMAAVRHANGIDVWIITHVPVSNEFRNYLVTCNGVSNSPVISSSGLAYPEDWRQGFRSDLIGVLKASPDGKTLFSSSYSETGISQLYNFNSNTGIISNAFTIPLRRLSIGAEYSADSKFIYIGDVFPNAHKVLQFNTSVYNPATILSSRFDINVGFPPGGMQIGPDNKIYITGFEMDSFLHVIQQPQNAGAACDLRERAQSLGGRSYWLCLPTFMPNLFASQSAAINFTTNQNCATVSFTGTSTLQGTLSWLWDFGDGNTSTLQNPTHTYAATGNIYNVTLRVTSNQVCGEAIIGKQVNLNRSLPDAGFRFNGQCGNNSVSFFDTSTITNGTITGRLWDFGDGNTSTQQNPVHTYAGTGNYTVTLRVENNAACGGFDIISKTVAIEAKPVADFNNSVLCANSAVEFRDNSNISAGVVNQWYWDFGDNTTSLQKNPVKTYNTPGNYTVKFVAKSATGCISDTLPRLISVSSKPTGSFTVADTCFGNTTRFTGSAAVTNGTITNWWWSLGNNSNSSVQNPNTAYAAPGNFTIRFAATANTGCASDTITRSVRIGSKPIAGFSESTQCGNKQVSFTGQSSNANEPVTGWYWNYGNAVTGNQQNPVYTYNSFGDYTVKFVAKSSLGCVSDTALKPIQVNAKPVGAVQIDNGCLNTSLSITENSAIEYGSITGWYWSFGDATSSTQREPVKVYNNTGNFTVKFAATSNRNCVSDTITKSITIEPKPVAAFTLKDGCAGEPLQLKNNSSISFGTIDKHYWNFGDGNTANTQLPGYSYTNGGNYIIEYTAVSKNGCVADTVKQPVLIETKPVVDFNFGNSCAGKEIPFENKTTNTFGSITGWQWNFGNNTSSTLEQPVITYSKFGNYPVTLTAVTANGCSSSLTKTVTIKEVKISAGRDTIAASGQPLQLQASGAASYSWAPPLFLNDFNIVNPVAVLYADRTYYLTGITGEGCIGYDTLNIKVYKGPEIYVPNAFVPQGVNRIFKPILVGIKELVSFEVYNRWGQLVFATKEQNKGWDGRFNNIPQPYGMFTWQVKAIDLKGITHFRKGTVLLIR